MIGFKYISFLILALAVLSCKKTNSSQQGHLTAGDTLGNWVKLDATIAGGSTDIWFISPTVGFGTSMEISVTGDAGATWIVKTSLSENPTFGNLFFTSPNDGFAEGLARLAVTNDGGNSWKSKPLPTTAATTIFFINASMGFVGDQSGLGLMRTIDSGNTWKTVYAESQGKQSYYPCFLNPARGFVVTASGTFASTTDSGQTWSSSTGVLPGNEEHYNQLLLIDTLQGFYVCSAGIFHTTNGGLSWLNVLTLAGSDVNVIKQVDENIFFYKSDHEIFESADGGLTWTRTCKLSSENLEGLSFFGRTGWACTGNGTVLKIQL